MRHRHKGRKLKRERASRQALVRGLVRSLILEEHITTTRAKALQAKSLADRCIGMGLKKEDSQHRRLIQCLQSRQAVTKVLRELTKRYQGRQSGFVRSFKVGHSLGDNAPRVRLELIKATITKSKKQKDAS